MHLAPPWTSNGKLIESATRKALYDFEMLDGAPLAIALSGGKDSLTLLVMLKAILGRGFPTAPLHAIHIGGPYSCGASIDLKYLQSICDALSVPLVMKESTQKLETLSCYPCSRERRSLLFDAAKEVGAKTVAFGHHRDDNAQTTLMNLLHKSEFAGNLPKLEMINVNITIIRPLIFVAEEQIRHFAKMQGFLRITCQCPLGQVSMRRKVNQMLDEMYETVPNARDNISNAALNYGSQKARRIKNDKSCHYESK